jgi:hypothetical protein
MRHALRAAALLAGPVCVLALLFFVASCGGGDGSQDQPTASATASVPTLTPDERAEAEALLRAAALRPEDVPEGLHLEDEGFATNEQLGEVGDVFVKGFYSANGVTLEDRFNSMGRILGYHTTYKADALSDPSFSGTVLFAVSVDLFRDSAGPHGDLERYRQHLPDEEALRENLQEAYEPKQMELRDLSVSSLPFPEVGDERLAWEMKTTIRAPGLDTDLNTVLRWVYIQRDRLVGSLMVTAMNASPPVQQLEDLARKLDERMKDALEQAPAP